MNDPDNVYVLKYPVTIGHELVTELRFRPAKIGYFKRLPKDDEVTAGILIMSRMTNQPPSIIEEINPEDFAGASEVMAGFLPTSPATGKTSPESSSTD